MNLLNDNGSRLCRFVAGRLGVASPSTSVTCLIIACLAVLMTFLSFACNGPAPTGPTPTRPTQHVRSTPTPTFTDPPSPTVPPTPPPTPFPPVTLTEPEDGAEFDWGSEITLGWSYPDGLQNEEYYRLKGRAKGSRSFLFYPDEDHFTLLDLSPGKYDWAVAVLRSIGKDMCVLASEESNWWSFTVAPPTPVAHSISPPSTFKGTGVPVVISGENFTHSLALTIGVPLQATFVNSSTITASIPITLGVGKYSVIVRDSLGQGESYASFTVSEPPTPTPIPVPTRPVYPPPVLGGVDIHGCEVTFHWSFDEQLASNDFFALRAGIGHPGESKTWTKETQQSWGFKDPGGYVWEIAICRGDPAVGHCEQLAVSGQGSFLLRGCGGGGEGPGHDDPDRE
jgi:hypothetical protein